MLRNKEYLAKIKADHKAWKQAEQARWSSYRDRQTLFSVIFFRVSEMSEQGSFFYSHFAAETYTPQELRSRPLLLVCRDRKGRERIMTLEECRRTSSVYIPAVTRTCPFSSRSSMISRNTATAGSSVCCTFRVASSTSKKA